MDTSLIKKQLQHFAESHKEIAAMYLFGSVLFKECPEDIDIAVLVDEKQAESRIDSLSYFTALISDLTDYLKVDTVDVVLLNTASPVIGMQVLRKGVIVFERDRKQVVAFTVSTAGRYDDLKMVLETGRAAYSQRENLWLTGISSLQRSGLSNGVSNEST